MAKAGFEIPQEFWEHRDPVSGQVKTFMRNSHARQSSPRLEAFKKCVAEGMRGTSARGGNAREDSVAIRDRFTQVAKSCSRGGHRAS